MRETLLQHRLQHLPPLAEARLRPFHLRFLCLFNRSVDSIRRCGVDEAEEPAIGWTVALYCA